MMNLEEAERWKQLERRARKRGWTIDSLDVGPDKAGTPAAGKLGAFALVELGGDERALAIGDLDMIETFLKSADLQDGLASVGSERPDQRRELARG
jgi:hypothetical protein